MPEKEWRTCCRCALHLFRDTDRCRAAVDAAERFAEGDAMPEELERAAAGLAWNGCITLGKA